MRILVLDVALARSIAAAVEDGHVVAERSFDADRGQAARLPTLAAGVLAEAGWPVASLHLIAVTVGPGSFTGIRAGLSFAQGIGLAADVAVVGVTVGEALAAAVPPMPGRPLWSAIGARRGRVFLDRDGDIGAYNLDALPLAPGPVAVAGDAAVEVAARLAASGADVMLTDARLPLVRDIARTAVRRQAGEVAPLAAQPLYIDPPEICLPSTPVRPPP